MDAEEKKALDIEEGDFCYAYGVSREEVREMRKRWLEEGADFEKKGRVIVLRAAGIRKLEKLILGDSGAKNGVCNGIAKKEAKEFWVLRAPINPGVVHAVADPALARKKKGPYVTVRVRSNRNFIPGMRIMAVHSSGVVYNLVGRCPRWRGRW